MNFKFNIWVTSPPSTDLFSVYTVLLRHWERKHGNEGAKHLTFLHSALIVFSSTGLEREKRKCKMCFPIHCKVSDFGYKV